MRRRFFCSLIVLIITDPHSMASYPPYSRPERRPKTPFDSNQLHSSVVDIYSTLISSYPTRSRGKKRRRETNDPPKGPVVDAISTGFSLLFFFSLRRLGPSYSNDMHPSRHDGSDCSLYIPHHVTFSPSFSAWEIFAHKFLFSFVLLFAVIGVIRALGFNVTSFFSFCLF